MTDMLTTKVDKAIQQGMDYLMDHYTEGYWKGFPTLAGESDIWVSGFVMSHIKELVNNNIYNTTIQFLLDKQKPNGGWSYSANVPPDTDSTAWCIQALPSHLQSDAIKKAKTFLQNQYNGEGWGTYHVDSGIMEFISIDDPKLIAGWISPHTDVTAAVLLADPHAEKSNKIVKWLLGKQKDNGCIASYWWRGPLYCTTLLLRALNIIQYPEKEIWIKKLRKGMNTLPLIEGKYLLDSDSSADAFNTALALETFTYLGGKKASMNCCNALLDLQQTNGSWEGGLIMRIPVPFVIDPDYVSSWNNANGGGNSLIEDKNGIFATAMSCYAMNQWRKSIP